MFKRQEGGIQLLYNYLMCVDFSAKTAEEADRLKFGWKKEQSILVVVTSGRPRLGSSLILAISKPARNIIHTGSFAPCSTQRTPKHTNADPMSARCKHHGLLCPHASPLPSATSTTQN